MLMSAVDTMQMSAAKTRTLAQLSTSPPQLAHRRASHCWGWCGGCSNLPQVSRLNGRHQRQDSQLRISIQHQQSACAGGCNSCQLLWRRFLATASLASELLPNSLAHHRTWQNNFGYQPWPWAVGVAAAAATATAATVAAAVAMAKAKAMATNTRCTP